MKWRLHGIGGVGDRGAQWLRAWSQLCCDAEVEKGLRDNCAQDPSRKGVAVLEEEPSSAVLVKDAKCSFKGGHRQHACSGCVVEGCQLELELEPPLWKATLNKTACFAPEEVRVPGRKWNPRKGVWGWRVKGVWKERERARYCVSEWVSEGGCG